MKFVPSWRLLAVLVTVPLAHEVLADWARDRPTARAQTWTLLKSGTC